MINRDKILQYLSDLMTPEEKVKFEQELAASEDLRNETAEINRQLGNLKDYSKLHTNEMYFNTILPRVRERMEKPKHKLIPRLSLASAFAVVILVFSLVYFPALNSRNSIEPGKMDLNSILASVDSSALNEVFDNNYVHEYSTYYDKSFLKEISDFTDDLEYSSDEEENYASSIYFNGTTSELINDMTSEELEDVYQTLLNKKFL